MTNVKLLRRTKAKSRKKVDTDKVGKLERMLVSDRGGEVAAAVAALGLGLESAGMDFNDLADAIVARLRPRKPERSNWGPPEPDLNNRQSMAWHSHFHRHHLRDDDRDYVVDALLDRAGFDLGRATTEMMPRLCSIVAKVRAARSAEGGW
jgi:hypothetical protein